MRCVRIVGDRGLELGRGLAPPVRQDQQAEHRHRPGREQTRDVGGGARGERRHRGAETDRAGLGQGGGGQGALHVLGEAARLGGAVVARERLARRPPDGVEQTAAVRRESARRSRRPCASSCTARRRLTWVDDRLPLVDVGGHQPVDERLDALLDLPRRRPPPPAARTRRAARPCAAARATASGAPCRRGTRRRASRESAGRCRCPPGAGRTRARRRSP